MAGKKAGTANGLMLNPLLTGFLGGTAGIMDAKETFAGEAIMAKYICLASGFKESRQCEKEELRCFGHFLSS